MTSPGSDEEAVAEDYPLQVPLESALRSLGEDRWDLAAVEEAELTLRQTGQEGEDSPA